MTKQDTQRQLWAEIRTLEQQFMQRKADSRPMSRCIAAAYRRSIEERTKRLNALD